MKLLSFATVYCTQASFKIKKYNKNPFQVDDSSNKMYGR